MMVLRKRKSTGGGAYGTYYPIGEGKGIKLLNGTDMFMDKDFRTIKEAKASENYVFALDEADLLKKAYRSGVTPKCYGVRIVKLPNGRYVPGVVMQHLGNKTLEKLPSKEYNNVESEIWETLEEIGIIHQDLHPGNIMKFKGKYYAIDFSADLIEQK